MKTKKPIRGDLLITSSERQEMLRDILGCLRTLEYASKAQYAKVMFAVLSGFLRGRNIKVTPGNMEPLMRQIFDNKVSGNKEDSQLFRRLYDRVTDWSNVSEPTSENDADTDSLLAPITSFDLAGIAEINLPEGPEGPVDLVMKTESVQFENSESFLKAINAVYDIQKAIASTEQGFRALPILRSDATDAIEEINSMFRKLLRSYKDSDGAGKKEES